MRPQLLTVAQDDLPEPGPAIVPREFLMIRLGKIECAIEKHTIQEIRGYQPVRPMADAPDFIRGVFTLGGEVVPLIDLRLRFQFESVRYDTSVIVLLLEVSGRRVGFVVDRVHGTVSLAKSQITQFSSASWGVDSSYILGVGVSDGRRLILLDLHPLLLDSVPDAQQLEQRSLKRRPVGT